MRLKIFVAVVLMGSLGTARAGDPAKLDCSLKHVPADALFYNSSLRMGEQIDLFLKSKAYAQLRAMPAAKFAFEHMKREAMKPDNPLGHVIQFLQASENRELSATLLDLVRNEIFMYGGESSIKLLGLGAEIGATAYFGAIAQRFGMNDPDELIREILNSVKDNLDDVVAPEIVMGFRTTKPDGARSALARLDGVIQQVMKQAPPPFRDRIKRQKIGNAEGLVLSLDGSLVPWEKVNIEQYEDEKGEFKSIVDKLKSMTIAVTLVVKEDFLLLTIGGDTSPVTKFGSGTSLGSVPEFAPLSKFTEQKLVTLGYTSRKLAELMATTEKDIQDMMKSAKEGLDQAPLNEKLREKIAKDLDRLSTELAGALPKPAASMSFEFVNERGVEGFTHVYDEANPNARPVESILNQLGGSPILAIVGRTEDATPGYKKLVGWIKTFYGHAEEAVKELADEGQVEQFKGMVGQVLPYLQRFNDITANQYLPAFADGQWALVVDSKWTSKKWFPELDQGGHELPMLEIGLVWGISDADKWLQALEGYRKLVNDMLDVARTFGAPIPEGGWPEPKSKKAGSATLYYWPLPAMGQDESIMPNLGLSKQFLTFTLSAQHAERMHASTSMKSEFNQLAGGKAILAGAIIDFNRLVNTARPWVEKLGVPALLAEAKDNAPEGLRKQDIPPQVKTVLDVLGCLKGYREVTYRDGNSTVTRFVTVIEDLK